jgi:mRNA interferase HigB
MTVANSATMEYTRDMRVISVKALREFWQKHPDAEQALRTWEQHVSRVNWQTPNDIKRDFATASFLADNRIVFNIRGNTYRLVTVVAYRTGIVYIRFVGTHAEYDRIDSNTI